MLYHILFPRYSYSSSTSYILLFLRIVFGILFMIHGIDKFQNFAQLSNTFPDIIGIGSRMSLILVVFAELVCSAAIILGVFFRLALIPMIINMSVAFGVAHHAILAQGELSLIYLIIFLMFFVTGPGKYAIDTPLVSYLIYKDDTEVKPQS